MKKTKNNLTGIVHGLTGKKVGPLELHETICGKSTRLFWLKADDDEPVTCMKCRSVLSKKEKERELLRFTDVMITKNIPQYKLRNNTIVLNSSILSVFTRDQLRILAEIMKVPKGRNKIDTVLSILRNDDKIEVTGVKLEIKLHFPKNVSPVKLSSTIHL